MFSPNAYQKQTCDPIFYNTWYYHVTCYALSCKNILLSKGVFLPFYLLEALTNKYKLKLKAKK